MENDESSNLTKTEPGCGAEEKYDNCVNLTAKLTENDENLDNVISMSTLFIS